MKKIILIFLFLFCVSPMYAQVVTVLDKSDLNPISNVVIHNSLKTVSVTCDSKGNADISSFNENDTLYFSHLAYQTYKLVKNNINKKTNKIYLTDKVVDLEEVVFSATRYDNNLSELPVKMDVINSKDIRFSNPQTTSDLLLQSGKVFVQSSQMGGGSPIIRGFEANRVLIVVDGVRLNNTIYRSGHLQNVITVDPNALARTEIIFGPGSVIYGSDALGGVMHFITQNPELSNSDKLLFKGSAFGRFASVNLEKTGNIVLNFGLKKVGFLTSFTYKDFDDLSKGRGYASEYGDWGKRPWYVETIDNCDTIMENSKSWVQKNTGYSQFDIMQKILYQPDAYNQIVANFQFSNSSDIPRYDRLTELKSGKPKYAEWYYGPQTRIFGSLSYKYTKANKAFDEMNLILAYQKINEQRVTRDFSSNKPTTKLRKFQDDLVHVGSLNLDMFKNLSKKNKLSYGIDINYNYVKSEAYNIDIVSGNKTYDNISRYPDNGINQLSAAAYILHNWHISPKFIFTQGLRYNYVYLNSSYTDTMFVLLQNPPLDKTNNMNNQAISGSLGFVAKPGYDWNVSMNVSTGFKAPNTDDVFKYNDSRPGAQLVAPNPGLKPEYAISTDLSVSKVFVKRVELSLTGFYSYIFDAIKLSNFPYNGNDSVLWNGQMCVTKANINVVNAYIVGCQADVSAQIFSFLTFQSTYTYTFGRDNNNMPLSHIPPAFGMTTLRFETKMFKAEAYSMYNFRKKYSDYDLLGEDNVQCAPKDANGDQLGLPGWYTLNLKLSFNINKYVQIQAGVENLLDLHYRVFASGVSAPGINVYGAIKLNY